MHDMSRRDTYNEALRRSKNAAAAEGRTNYYTDRANNPITRPVLTDAEKAVMEQRAKAALLADREDRRRDRATQNRFAYCEWCGEPATKRTLCHNHYQSAMRAGELEAYPTKQFLDNPSNYAVWLIAYFPELLSDALAQHGWDTTHPEPEATTGQQTGRE
jgi:RNA polymerase-binding transcription factor DksA